jgi:predicted RNase H-like HicB family nuclease
LSFPASESYPPGLFFASSPVDPGENQMLTYTLNLADRYDGMIIATIPDVPEAMGMGRDYEEACEEAQRALEAALERYVAEGLSFPAPSTAGKLTVSTERFEMLAVA